MTYLADYWEWERGDVIRRIGEVEAELERVKAERDEHLQSALYWSRDALAKDARLDKALSALQEIERKSSSRFMSAWRYEKAVRKIARVAIAEIEGEA